ncbi:hypothetical protein JTE90_005815 [Oedothorax gibbosus]|uniref:Uncharacterized protein n=1 Tax=Oedothorax gibbosus TaxID=931172 RepID=A0AAV6V4F1_9ARAC|nr:hypothetical protein JTE90_005815 [Oedothorax gibbosus]
MAYIGSGVGWHVSGCHIRDGQGLPRPMMADEEATKAVSNRMRSASKSPAKASRGGQADEEATKAGNAKKKRDS